MFLQRNYTVIKGDNMDGLGLLKNIQEFNLILSEIPAIISGTWERSVEKRVKIAKGLLAIDGAIALAVSNSRVGSLEKIMNKWFGKENHIISYVMDEETLLIYGENSSRNQEKIQLFKERIQFMNRYDLKREKKWKESNVSNTSFLKEIVQSFTPEDGTVLDMYADKGMVGISIWELNHEKNSQRRFTLLNHEVQRDSTKQFYPLLMKQSLIYETPFDYLVLEKKEETLAI